MVDFRPFRLVFGLAVDFKQLFYFVEHGLFGFIVRGSVIRSSLEHQVFEIMGESGGFRRIVLASYVNGNVGLDSRRFLVYAHVHFETVVKGVDFGSERVSCHGIVFVLRAGCDNRHYGNCHKNKDSFHRYNEWLKLILNLKPYGKPYKGSNFLLKIIPGVVAI